MEILNFDNEIQGLKRTSETGHRTINPTKYVSGTLQGWGKVVGGFEGLRHWPSES